MRGSTSVSTSRSRINIDEKVSTKVGTTGSERSGARPTRSWKPCTSPQERSRNELARATGEAVRMARSRARISLLADDAWLLSVPIMTPP